MRAIELEKALVQHTVENCGHKEHREYLGMSRISMCPRRLFFEVRDGTLASVGSKLRFYKGHQEEKDILARLALVVEALGAKAIVSDEVGESCALDERFRGHPDGELVMLDGSERILIEIKSTVQEKLNRIRKQARIPTHHWWQVQCYLHFGDGWERAFVVYEARDTGQIYVHEARYHQPTGEKCERKARLVLEALEMDEAPECWCGHCQ